MTLTDVIAQLQLWRVMLPNSTSAQQKFNTALSISIKLLLALKQNATTTDAEVFKNALISELHELCETPAELKNMTIQDLYDWAEANGYLDYELSVDQNDTGCPVSESNLVSEELEEGNYISIVYK